MSAAALRDDDVVELAELLEFLFDWLNHTRARRELDLFTGYNVRAADVQADLARFVFLLGGSDDPLVRGGRP